MSTCSPRIVSIKITTTTNEFKTGIPLRVHERWHCEKFNGWARNCKCVCTFTIRGC